MNTHQNNPSNNPAFQGQMAQAVLKATKESEEKMKEKEIVVSGEIPSIVVRKDVLGHNFLFRADKEDRTKGVIEYWDGKKGSQMQVAPIEFYRNTKPIESDEEVKKLVQDFSRQFGYKNFNLRARLMKESVMRKADPAKEGDDKAARKEFADKLVSALTKAVYQALGE